jgi:hypothetical protein
VIEERSSLPTGVSPGSMPVARPKPLPAAVLGTHYRPEYANNVFHLLI